MAKINEPKASQACNDASRAANDLGATLHELADSHFPPDRVGPLWHKIQGNIDTLDSKLQDAEYLIFPGTQNDPYTPLQPPAPPAPTQKPPAPVIATPPAAPAPSTLPTPAPVIPSPMLTLGPATWLGEWSGSIWSTVHNIVTASAASKVTPVFIGYNIPGRDNGNYSRGGLHSPDEFYAWYGSIADAIGNAAAWIVVEPDALGLMAGLPSDAARSERMSMLKGVVRTLQLKPNIRTYIDASMWVPPQQMAQMLNQFTGDMHPDGFSCNVSGYERLEEVQAWAEQVSNLTGLRYIVDTSRNGNGNPHKPAWCNVTDTKVGVAPTLTTNSKNAEAYFWGKVPGESDGLKINGFDNDGQQNRNDIPGAGGSWPEFKEAIYSGDWSKFKAKYHI